MCSYKIYIASMLLTIHALQLQANTDTIYTESQLEEECGISDGTLHQHEEHRPKRGVQDKQRVGKEQNKNYGHLKNDETKLNQSWPWETIIQKNGKFKCNGMLVKKNWVLTTASCIDGDTLGLEILVKGESYKTVRVYQHTGFDRERPRKMAGDLGLIKLERPIPIEVKEDITPICLPRSKRQMKQTTECAVTYIGIDKNNSTTSYTSAAKIINTSYCETDGMQIDGSINLLMCIATTDHMKIPCDNKPILYFMCKSSGYWSIYGVGKFCNLAKSHKQYSAAYYLQFIRYLEWIKEKVKEESGAIE